jgi:dihydrofolate reductase
MAKIQFNMTMSLDGFVNDQEGNVDWLYPDLPALGQTDLMQDTIKATGAVIMGKRTFEMSEDPDWYAGNYEFQVPIFVICEEAPAKVPKQTAGLTFAFVTDGLESALRQAEIAAGEKQVTVVGGPSIGQQLLRAGLVDELRIGIMPVLLGKGLRLFEHLDDLPVRLEKIRVQETGPRTDIWFKVGRLHAGSI